MIDAVIYDMDGVILDSEPFWQQAQIEVYKSVGILLTPEKCLETTGTAVDESVAYRYQQQPWSGKTQEEVMYEILDSVERIVQERGVLLPGVTTTINYFKNKNLPLALASSSPMKLINAVLKKFDLEHAYRIVHSAEHEDYGKPHPAVFLSTAHRLKIDPERCLVIEDSFNGLLAAKAAKMKTIVVPSALQFHETRFAIADLTLQSLADFSDKHWNRLNALP